MTRCSKCAYWRTNNQKEPLIPHDVPTLPWQKLGADKGQNCLCVMNYYSKFPEISLLPSRTVTSVMIHLKSVFARHGISTNWWQIIRCLQAANCKVLQHYGDSNYHF